VVQIKLKRNSGYANDPIMADFKQWGFRAVVSKPYTIDELQKALHDLFIP